MKVIRCIGGAAVLAATLLAVTGAGPAMAAPPTVSINAPVADSVQQAAFAISGSAHQDGGGSPTITSLKVKLTDDDGWLPPTEQNYSGSAGGVFSGGGDTVSYNWTNNAPKYNGPYTVTVTAVGQYQTLTGPQSQSATLSKSFHVEIPPAPPTGVTATMAEGSTAVTVKWAKNPEPDIAGYVVYRSYQGASGKQVGSVDASKQTWADDLASQPAGTYKYAVQAVRHARSCKSASNVDEACSRGIAGKQSAYSSQVTVRGQTTTTTTTIKKSGGGGSGGGVTTTTRPDGSGGGTSGGTSGGARTGGARNGSTGGFAPGGEVDLSQFGSLLNPKARGGTSGSGRANEPEGTFDENLPYGEGRVNKPSDDDNSLITIGGASIPQPSDDWVKFIGAGSFVTAILVHVLWFKQQVDRLPLEAID